MEGFRRPYKIETKRANDFIIRSRNRAFKEEYLKSHPCVDCGESDVYVLEFDHINGERLACVSQLRQSGLNRLKQEIKKCEVRCANCHRRKHKKEGWFVMMKKEVRVRRARAGGTARGWQERKAALERYNQTPHFCHNCFEKIEVGDRRVADVSKKKFCSYSCSSLFSNRERKLLTEAQPVT